MANSNLNAAAKNKNDEFYTQYDDIQREMNCYYLYNNDFLRGKTVLLPCDDPEWSMFTEFFIQNFNLYGLKKLISTSYAVNSKKIKFPAQPTLWEATSPHFDADITDSRGKIFTLDAADYDQFAQYPKNLKWRYLEGDGDFRSDEVKKLREEADVIITNPPFSLFREFLKWINPDEKKFVIIGNKNCITYKEVFPLIMQNKIWVGAMPMGQDILFKVTPETEKYFIENEKEGSKYKIVKNKILGRSAAIWITNLEHEKRHEPLRLMTMKDNLHYNKKLIKAGGYRKYDNYDAIDVPFTDAIPSDYFCDMGVPITFLDKYCPEQFEIVKFRKGNDEKDLTYTVEDNTILHDTTRHDTTRHDTTRHDTENYAVLQNHHSAESVTALWECQSHSLTSTIQSNLKYSVAPTNTAIAATTSPVQVGAQKLPTLTFTNESSSDGKCSGVMGVPITFLDKYCPEQFEILGMTENLDLYGLKTKIYTAKECRDRYFELFGKKGTYDLNAAGVIDGVKVYQRILIRHKFPDS